MWSNEWEGQAHWSAGTTNSKGVAILFKHNLDVKIENVNYDVQGRFLSLIATVDETKMHIVNVYDPNYRCNFFV